MKYLSPKNTSYSYLYRWFLLEIKKKFRKSNIPKVFPIDSKTTPQLVLSVTSENKTRKDLSREKNQGLHFTRNSKQNICISNSSIYI